MNRHVIYVPLAALVIAAPGTGAGQDSRRAIHVPLDDRACRALVTQHPDPDVSYRPGVDVTGRPVVPADLPAANPARLGDSVVVTLTLDLARQYGILAVPQGIEAQAVLATVLVQGNRVTINGQPAIAAGEAALAEACRRRGF